MFESLMMFVGGYEWVWIIVIVGKCLDQFDIEHDLFTRWGSE